MSKHLSKENEIQIIEYYKTKPMTIKELCDKFNLCNVKNTRDFSHGRFN